MLRLKSIAIAPMAPNGRHLGCLALLLAARWSVGDDERRETGALISDGLAWEHSCRAEAGSSCASLGDDDDRFFADRLVRGALRVVEDPECQQGHALDAGGPGFSVLEAARIFRFTDVAGGDVPAYDGHHLAIYVNGDAWTATYDQLFVRGLLYNNPRFPQFKYDSLKDALEHNEFRIRGFPDLDAVEGHGHPIIFELEHEIRNLRHPGFALKSRLPRGPEHGFFGNEL